VEQHSAIVFDDGTESLGELATRLVHLGLEVRRVRRPSEAGDVLKREGERVAAIFVPPSCLGPDLEAFLASARRFDTRPPTVFAVGPCPDDETRYALGAAGIEFALWEPYDDGTLRFMLNERIAQRDEATGRIETRVPTTLFAKVEVGERRKDALVYNLSTSGLYLETPRPSVRGARVTVVLQLPDGELRAPAIVAYANVPGNIQRKGLPLGMGVRFTELAAEDGLRLHRYVEERAQRFRVSPAERVDEVY
jgi:hypothetical protein